MTTATGHGGRYADGSPTAARDDQWLTGRQVVMVWASRIFRTRADLG